jgi:hypothetical protein
VLHIRARKILITYINQQLSTLGNEDLKDDVVTLKEIEGRFNKDEYNVGDETVNEMEFVNFMAWNGIVSYVEFNTNQLKALAGLKSETPEETLKRLQQNSNK